MMGKRSPEQRAAFTGAKDTIDIEVPAVVRDFVASRAAKIILVAAGICTGVAAAVAGQRLGWFKKARHLLSPGAAVCVRVAKGLFGFATGPAAQELGGRVVTRIVDWGVPLALVVTALSALSDGDAEASQADGSSGGLLKKLLKGDAPSKLSAAPAKEYIQIESLGDKLNSMAYSIRATTASKAEASRVQRRRDLSRRFGDELGNIGDTALAGVVAAEASWRTKMAAPAAAAAAARAELRAVSVKLGGESTPKGHVGEDDGGDGSESEKALKKKMKRAQQKLLEALKEGAELEASFMRGASASLGDGAWEARAALAKLATAPVSWDPEDVPLPHNAGLGGGARAFVLDFEGDAGPAQVVTLREEITAIVHSADAKRGDSVVLRLVSGGGSVTGYGLAMAQLLRLKEAGLHLTICVEQVAASGGYMMACVADKIVASPFAVLGSIGVITQIPNVYERLKKEGVEFQTVTAGEFKRTLTPFKKLDQRDVQKTEEEISEIFSLFKSFVGKQRPQLDIDSVATGETWFGQDAIERHLADALQTFDDTLLELHTSGVEIYSVKFKKPAENPLEKLGIGSRAGFPPATAPSTSWVARVLAAAIGVPPHPLHAYPYPEQQHQPQLRDPRYSS